MFNLNQFKQDVFNRGVIRPHNFMVEIPIPVYVSKMPNSSYKSEKLSIRCETAQIPGISFASLDGPPMYGYGPIESVPYSTIYDPVSLTFLMDRDSETHKFFTDWFSCIVNFSRTKETLDETSTLGFKTYEVGYKNKYSSDMTVNVYDDQQEKIMNVKLLKAFPRAIQPIDLGWDQYDNLMKMTVAFAYREHRYEYF